MIKSTTWGPMAILVGRYVFSSVVLLIYVRHIPLRIARWKLVAAASHILTAFLFISATKMTTAANAIFLQYTAPLYIVILGYWFLRESPTRTDWISMPIIFGGMLLFLGNHLSLDSLHGIILAMLSGITMALMTVALRAQKHENPVESLLLAQLFTVIVGLPVLARQSWSVPNLLIIAYLGVFQIGLAFLLFATAIKHVPAIEATLISTLEPILNPVWVLLFNGERPGTYAIVGGLVVLAGVAVSARGSARALANRSPMAS